MLWADDGVGAHQNETWQNMSITQGTLLSIGWWVPEDMKAIPNDAAYTVYTEQSFQIPIDLAIKKFASACYMVECVFVIEFSLMYSVSFCQFWQTSICTGKFVIAFVAFECHRVHLQAHQKVVATNKLIHKLIWKTRNRRTYIYARYETMLIFENCT